MYEEWHHKTTGLSGPAATAIALAVAVATGGMGAPMVGAANGTMTAAMANAGFSTLVSQAAVALINNKGNILGALEDMGSSEHLIQLATSIVGAGITAGITNAAGLSNGVNASLPSKIGYNFTSSVVGNTVSNALHGENLLDGLDKSVLEGVVTSFAQEASQYIGSEYKDSILKNGGETPDAFLAQKIAHGLVGCATGAILSQNCQAGAVGAITAETVADLIIDPGVKSLMLVVVESLVVIRDSISENL